MRSPRTCNALLIVALAILSVLPMPARAMRYVQFDIWLNDKRILRASTGDDGHRSEKATWEHLRRLPLRSMNGFSIPAVKPSQRQITLKGALIVETGVTQAKVTSLRLVRDNAKASWQLAPEEIDRLIKQGKPVTAPRQPQPG